MTTRPDLRGSKGAAHTRVGHGQRGAGGWCRLTLELCREVIVTDARSDTATIIGGPVSPYVRKVLAVCEIKGVPYRLDPIVPFFGDDAFSEISPLRRIPVFIDDKVSLCDSTVICEYLEDRFPARACCPSIPPGAPRRAGSRSSPTPAWATSSSGASSTRPWSCPSSSRSRATRTRSQRSSPSSCPR